VLYREFKSEREGREGEKERERERETNDRDCIKERSEHLAWTLLFVRFNFYLLLFFKILNCCV